MDWNFDQKLVKAAQKTEEQESIGKQKKSIIDKAARVWLVIGVIVLVALALGAFSMVARGISQRAALETQQEIKRVFDNEVHLAIMKGLRAENDALDRIRKLQRSARTNEQHAFYRSEWAKLRDLSAARKREIEQIKRIGAPTERDLDELRSFNRIN